MTRSLVAVAALAAAVFPAAGPAAADPICVSVDRTGSSGPPLGIGPVCVPYGGATHCRAIDVGFAPPFIVTVYVCVPR